MAPDYHTATRSKQLGSALSYAARGIPVFPLKGKKPRTSHGFYDATTDPSRITAWWNRYPDANIGVPTGGVSGLVVVDRDVDKGEDSSETTRIWASLPPTLEVSTSRGRHRYYRVPKGTKVKSHNLAADLDLKADGGYVVGAPGIHPSGARYEYVEETKAIGVADLPQELLEVRGPEPPGGGHDRGPAAERPLDDGGPIHEGARNSTLFFAALDLKESGKSREEALADLLSINSRRCLPPLGEDEVERVVTSAFRYPARGTRTPPEVLEMLSGLTQAWWDSAWSGVGGKSERDLIRILIQWAERYGLMVPTGVRISISFRDLAMAAGVGKGTIQRAVKRLKVAGWLRGDNAERCGTDSGAFVLLPRQGGYTQAVFVSAKKEDAESVPTLSRLPEQTPCFRWRGFVGKGKAGVLNALEVFGPQSVDELAERIGWSRVRDLRARYLVPLVELGLIEDRGGVYALVGGYVERVEEIRGSRYGGGERKVTSKGPDGRVVRRVIHIPAKSEVEREADDRRRFERQRNRYRERLGVATPVGVVNDAPTEEEMRAYRESYPLRRRQGIEGAIAALFSERPEYRTRRVGQVTCALAHYLPDDFPRGEVGLPKDAEVEDILDGVAA
jgi:hypothetical protein